MLTRVHLDHPSRRPVPTDPQRLPFHLLNLGEAETSIRPVDETSTEADSQAAIPPEYRRREQSPICSSRPCITRASSPDSQASLCEDTYGLSICRTEHQEARSIAEKFDSICLTETPVRKEPQLYTAPHCRLPRNKGSLSHQTASQARSDLPFKLNPSSSRSLVPFPYQADLGEYLTELTVDRRAKFPPARIRDVKLAGGYKWAVPLRGCTQPTMVVPGVPDIWVGRGNSRTKLVRDDHLPGNVEYEDYNDMIIPRGIDTFDPVYNSLTHPRILKDVQLMTARNSLKVLFRFCVEQIMEARGQGGGKNDWFRIDANVLEGTELVHLYRYTPSRDKKPRHPVNFHLSYHEQNTMILYEGADRTPGCHRVIKYDFGGLTMMVRSDVSAALPWEGIHTRNLSTVDYVSEFDDDETMSLDDADNSNSIYASEATTFLSRQTTTDCIFPASHILSSGIRVLPGQYPHPPQGHLISLKTRIGDGDLDDPLDLKSVNHVEELFAVVFFGQIPNLYLAKHRDGKFGRDTQKFRLDEGSLKDLEIKYETAIRWVRTILGWMIMVTRKYGNVSFVGHQGSLKAFNSDRVCGRLSDETWEVIRKSGLRHRRT